MYTYMFGFRPADVFFFSHKGRCKIFSLGGRRTCVQGLQGLQSYLYDIWCQFVQDAPGFPFPSVGHM